MDTVNPHLFKPIGTLDILLVQFIVRVPEYRNHNSHLGPGKICLDKEVLDKWGSDKQGRTVYCICR